MGDSSTVEQRTLTPSILVRIQVPQPLIKYLILHPPGNTTPETRTSAWRNQNPLPYRSSLFGNRPMHPPSQLLLVAPTAAGPYCAAGRTACFRSVRAGGDVDELRYAVGLIVMAAIRFWASRVWSNHGLRSRPAAKTAARSADAFLHSATRSTGCRHSVDSSAPRAATIWPTTLGNIRSVRLIVCAATAFNRFTCR